MNELIKAIKEFNKERDWDKFHSPSNLSKSIVIEASELLECFQWSDEDYKIDNVKEEVADVLIYALTLCNKLNLDPKVIILDKLNKNAKKYPVEKAKGNSKKYNEFEVDND